ncbi:MAG: DUF3443 family protein [Alphaproteobacteria bacterium]|nr:DUF3443 family protein [Alphaproteobacteria bacterium]
MPGIGANPNIPKPPQPINNSFDFGLPFFFGKTIFTAIEGRNAGTPGPSFAF